MIGKMFIVICLFLLISPVFAGYNSNNTFSSKEEARISFLNYALGNPLQRTLKLGTFDTGLLIVRTFEPQRTSWVCKQRFKGVGDYYCLICGGCS